MAQLVEQRIRNAEVVGSSPALGTLPNVLSAMSKRSAFLFPNSF